MILLCLAVQNAGAKGFPTPDFQPSLTFLELNKREGTMDLKKSCPLKGRDGSPVTGLSVPSVDLPYTKDCGAALDTDGTGVHPAGDYFCSLLETCECSYWRI